MNVQLDNVLSDIMGKTGQLIVRAIVAGERDGAVLAGFRDGRCKADAATIAASLRGNWRDEHLFALAQALARHDMLQGQIEACEARIDAELERHAPADTAPIPRSRERALRERLRGMLGVDLTAIPTIGVETALTLAAEVGPDLSRFPTAAHFCSWLGLAPGTRISGDKRLGGPPARRTNRLGQALCMAASTARNNKTAIGAAHRRRLSRMDSAKAVKATAHQLARRGSPGPVRAHAPSNAPSNVGPAMLSVASTRTGPGSSAIIAARGEKCGLGGWDRNVDAALASLRLLVR